MRKIGLVAALAFTTVAHAEPGPVGRWLMNEPVSIWTFGMAQLGDFVFGWKGNHPLAYFTKGVNYDWEENRITISVDVSEQFDKKKCSLILKAIRESGHVVEGKVVTAPFQKHSVYADFFGPIGFKKSNVPNNYLERLDDIFRVKATFNGGGCEGRLVSTEVLYRDAVRYREVN